MLASKDSLIVGRACLAQLGNIPVEKISDHVELLLSHSNVLGIHRLLCLEATSEHGHVV
jgi:hypothetical protein